MFKTLALLILFAGAGCATNTSAPPAALNYSPVRICEVQHPADAAGRARCMQALGGPPRPEPVMPPTASELTDVWDAILQSYLWGHRGWR